MMWRSLWIKGDNALRALLLLTLATFVGACREDCASPAAHRLRVSVINAQTQRPLEQVPTVRIFDGEYSEVLVIDESRPTERRYLGSYERTGNYTVRVEAQGFTPVIQENVSVTRERRCSNITPVEITIAMSPTQ